MSLFPKTHVATREGDLEYQPTELRAAYRVFELNKTYGYPFKDIAVWRDGRRVLDVEGWMWDWLRAEEEYEG